MSRLFQNRSRNNMGNAELSYQGDNLKIKKAVFNKLKKTTIYKQRIKIFTKEKREYVQK